MLEYYFSGAGLRLGQSIVYASLWIVIGLLIAGIFRYMLGPEKVRKLFGEGTRRGIFTGWLIGMLLPVCSLGVIPIIRELQRSEVKGGTIIAFALTAPLFNPMSVLYGLTLSDPIAIMSFSLCALLIVSVLGILWDRFFFKNESSDFTEALPTPGIKRVSAIGYNMCREITGASGLYILIGILGSVLMAVAFQKGYLQGEVEHDNWKAPITVAFIALPIYSTPLLAMSQIGGMFQHGNSIGAAFSLLILGAGANLGVVAWFGASFGWKKALSFLGLLALTTISLAYAVDKPLYPKGVEPAGHSHAFDVYSHPFHWEQPKMRDLMTSRMGDFWEANEFGGTYIFAMLIVIGVALSVFDHNKIEAWFYSEGNKQGGGFDVPVPEWTVGAAAVIGLVVASVAGAYLYYPAPNELLPEMFNVNTDCYLDSRNGKWEAAEKWIAYSDDLSRRLEVGVFLRNGSVDPFKTAKAKNYREKLDRVKQAVEERDLTEMVPLTDELLEAYRRMSEAFKEEEADPAVDD